MKGYYITIKRGLLDPKHFRAMGGDKNIGTIWLYLWILDKMTIIDKATELGLVWGGKPVRYEDVQADLGISRATYKRWLNMLRDGDYISTLRTPLGLVITVHKAYKIFGLKAENGRLSDKPSMVDVRAIDRQDVSHRWSTREPSIYIDNNTDITMTMGKFVEKQQTRSTESEAKERIRALVKSGDLKKLKQD